MPELIDSAGKASDRRFDDDFVLEGALVSVVREPSVAVSRPATAALLACLEMPIEKLVDLVEVIERFHVPALDRQVFVVVSEPRDYRIEVTAMPSPGIRPRTTVS